MPTLRNARVALDELDALLVEYIPRPRDLPAWPLCSTIKCPRCGVSSFAPRLRNDSP